MNPKRGVGSQALYLAAATGLAQGLVALIYLFAARGTAPIQFGLVVAAIALGTSAAGFVDFGTNALWIREIAQGRMHPAVLGERLFGKILLTTVAAAAWAITVSLLFPATLFWIAGPYMLVLVMNQASQVPLRASARGELVALSVIVDRVVALIAFFITVLSGVASGSALILALIAGSMAASLMGWCMSSASIRPTPTFWIRSNPWRGSRFFGLANLANSAQALDLVLLSAVAGPTALGTYGAVNRWTQPMTLLASAFSSAAAPFVAKSPNIMDAWTHLRRGIWMPFAAIGVSACVFILAPWIVPILLGNAYSDSAGVLRILALASILSILSQPAFVSLQAVGRDRYVAVCMVIAVLLQLGLVCILGAYFGVLGGSWAALIMQALLSALLFFGIWHEIRRNRKTAFLVKE